MTALAWSQVPVPQRVRLAMLRTGWPRDVEPPRLFQAGALAAMVSLEPVAGDPVERRRWHVSISHPSRFPTWSEIGSARDALIPADVCMAIPFPPRAWWLSIHPNCFHLWQLADVPLLDLWRDEGEQAQRAGYGVPQPERRG